MSQDKNSLQPEPPDTLTQTMKDIEEELAFKSYLDAVNAGSNRTRSTVYVLVAMVVIIFTGYRNTTSPDWLDQRLAKFQIAAACVKENSATECITNNPSQSPECTEALAYAKHFLFADEKNPLLIKREFCSELNDQMAALMKLRTEALSIRLPFFGMVIDVNDLALISDLFLAFILYVLYVGIDRETDNLDRAIGRAKEAKTEERQKENLELLLMTQVLASKKGATYGVHIVLLFVVITCGFVFWDDLMTYHTAVQLLGRLRGILENVFVAIVFLVVAVLCLFVGIKQWRLDIRVDNLIHELSALEKKLLAAGGTGGDRLIAS